MVSLAIPVSADTQSAVYGPVVGVSVNGSGAASGQNQPVFVATAAATSVTVVLEDDSGTDPFFSVCINLNANTLCSRTDGDAQASGTGTVTLAPPGGIPADARVTAYVYAVYVGLDGTVGLGTSGVATATFT